MRYVVFSQSEGIELPASLLVAHGRAHFGLAIELASRVDAATPPSVERLVVDSADARGVFLVTIRAVAADDMVAARGAEQRGRAAGMSDLAARCPKVWLLDPDPAAPEWLTLEVCALLAFTALGPILPPDHATLLGVRSARERAARLPRSPAI